VVVEGAKTYFPHNIFILSNLYSVTFLLLLAYRYIGRFYYFLLLHYCIPLDWIVLLLSLYYCNLYSAIPFLSFINALLSFLHYFHIPYCASTLPLWYQSHKSCDLSCLLTIMFSLSFSICVLSTNFKLTTPSVLPEVACKSLLVPGVGLCRALVKGMFTAKGMCN
jgi:hypothetical protein